MRRLEVKRDGLGRTLETVETVDAVLLSIPLRIFLRDGPQRAVFYAFLTACAIVRHRPPEDPEAGGDREEGSQRAEVTTPESFPQYPQGEDGEEYSEDEQVHLEQRHGNG